MCSSFSMERFDEGANFVDFLSGLPNDLLQLTLSQLEMKDIFSLSLVSRRFRHLWKNTQHLYFNGYDWVLDTLHQRFPKFVFECLARNNSTVLKSVEIMFAGYHCPNDIFDDWMYHICSKPHVKVAIQLSMSSLLVLPYNLIDESVVEVYFDNNIVGESIISFPLTLASQLQARSLANLILSKVLLVPNSRQRLVITFSVLQVFNLFGCTQRGIESLEVNCPKLRELTIINRNPSSNTDTVLWIKSEDLQMLRLDGPFYRGYKMEAITVSTILKFHMYGTPTTRQIREFLDGVQTIEQLQILDWSTPEGIKKVFGQSLSLTDESIDEFKYRLDAIQRRNAEERINLMTISGPEDRICLGEDKTDQHTSDSEDQISFEEDNT